MKLFEDQFNSKKHSPTFELTKQEFYVRVKALKGELGIIFIGDQSRLKSLQEVYEILRVLAPISIYVLAIRISVLAIM
ncbi:hypothetical protein CUMW_105930 [Citrus unshiu]|nr:hypothetical protein CUMW_105930 [Citrus unshiu]